MELILFLIIGLTVIGAGMMVILTKNPVTSALYLTLAFFGLAALYVLLGAPFIAALQVMVYAGAIMVLFLFIVMLLNLRDKQTWELTTGMRRALGLVVAAGILLVALAAMKGLVSPPAPLDADMGSPAAVGLALYRRFLLPFEVASVLLLIAIIGVVAMLKQKSPEQAPEGGGTDGRT